MPVVGENTQESPEQETPPGLRPYIFHGLDPQCNSYDNEAVCECPFCGRENKFSINKLTGQWRCFVCNTGDAKKGKTYTGGNAYVFLRKYYELCKEAPPADYSELASDRRLKVGTLAAWGLVKSVLTGDWLLPGYGADGLLKQLYVYKLVGDRYALLATPQIKTQTEGHQLFGMSLFNKKCKTIYLCEGPWDAMALWEILRIVKAGSEHFRLTSKPKQSLLADSSVLAVPTCTVFKEIWVPLFAGKFVTLLFDNDHPRVHKKTGATIPPAGLSGMKRIASVLRSAKKPPAGINYLCWGPEGFDTEKPSGFDVRDLLKPKKEDE